MSRATRTERHAAMEWQDTIPTQPAPLSTDDLRNHWPPRRGGMDGVDIDAVHRTRRGDEAAPEDGLRAARGAVFALAIVLALYAGSALLWWLA